MTFYQSGQFSSMVIVPTEIIFYNKLLNVKTQFLIKSDYYIIPSPSTALTFLLIQIYTIEATLEY